MLTTKEGISWWYPVPSFDFCYPLLCKNNICCRKPALILYHTKHIMSVRVLTGSCWRKWAPLIRQKCVLFGFLESNCSLTLPMKKYIFVFIFIWFSLFICATKGITGNQHYQLLFDYACFSFYFCCRITPEASNLATEISVFFNSWGFFHFCEVLLENNFFSQRSWLVLGMK